MALRRSLVGVFAATVLVVTAAAAGGAPGSTYGLHVVAPPGWDVRSSRGTIVGSTARLPTEGRWIGQRLSQSIGPRDLEFVLFEDAGPVADPASNAIYRQGRPKPFTQADFGPPPLGGSNPGDHRFARRNFTVSSRFFDLFVESGRTAITTSHLASLNQLVTSLTVRPGDFYPGSVAGPTFARNQGWTVLGKKRTPFAPETSARVVAATVPYRDHLNEFPPHRTLKVLPQDGIIILVQLVASNRDPPIGRPPDRGHVAVKRCGAFEGAPVGVAVCPISGLRDHQFAISGWILYGQPNPTRSIRRLMSAELARLVLPTWPRWH